MEMNRSELKSHFYDFHITTFTTLLILFQNYIPSMHGLFTFSYYRFFNMYPIGRFISFSVTVKKLFENFLQVKKGQQVLIESNVLSHLIDARVSVLRFIIMLLL